MGPLLLYLLIVNLLGAALFVYDKSAAKLGTRRIPESLFHVLEALGAALLLLPLIFVLRHKSAKRSYWLITAVCFVVWILLWAKA